MSRTMAHFPHFFNRLICWFLCPFLRLFVVFWHLMYVHYVGLMRYHTLGVAGVSERERRLDQRTYDIL